MRKFAKKKAAPNAWVLTLIGLIYLLMIIRAIRKVVIGPALTPYPLF
jgi:hypothetical protein